MVDLDRNEEDAWSSVASEWVQLWGSFGGPVRAAIVAATGIGEGTRVLDVGCGSGEFLDLLVQLGADPSGVDPAPAMVALAGPLAQLGQWEQLPWADDTFDVVTAVNSLQFAEDTLDALAEAKRVTRPGGLVAVANWAEGALNDLNVIEAAVADKAGEETLPDGDLRPEGGLERLFQDAGLEVVTSGLVSMPWHAPDMATLVRGVLLGEDDEVMAALAPVILDAAQPFQVENGYVLNNAFRYAVGRVS